MIMSRPFVAIFCFSALFLNAQTTLTVDVAGDNNVNAGSNSPGGTFSNNAGDLRGVLNHININPGNYIVQFAPNVLPTINLNAMLPLLNLNAANTILINGEGGTINGGGTYPGFFARQGNITLQNLTFSACAAIEGAMRQAAR